MSKRAALAKEIKQLADKVQTWNAQDETRWEELNLEYDAEHGRELVANATADTGNRSRIGRDGGTIAKGPVNRQAFGLDPDDGMGVALASWVRNASGESIPADDFQRSLTYGADPRAGAFNITLPTGMPTMGLSFTPMASQSSQVGTGGGFTVPSMLLPRLESALKLYSCMLNTSEVWITTDGRETGWPTCDDTSNTGSQVGENTDVGTATDLEFGVTQFRAYKATTGVLKAPHELLRDSALQLATAIVDKLGERLGRFLNTRLTTGTGAATAKGIVNCVTTGKTAASATAIAMDELIELQHSIDPAIRQLPGVGFMMHDNVASSIRRLKDGNGNYLWQNSVQAGQPPMLLGYPVSINPDMASSIASGATTVLFGHLPAYKVRLVGAVRMRTLVERYAEYDQTGFIGFQEFDGNLLKPSATASLCPVRALVQA